MSIQKRIGYGVVVLVAMVQDARGDDGRVSQDTLQQMGLGGLASMSDSEAESVRGLGFNGGGNGSWAKVSGSSFATIDSRYGDAHSENKYSSGGEHSASGRNNSYAGAEISTNHHKSGNDNGGNWGGNGSGHNNSGCDNWGNRGNNCQNSCHDKWNGGGNCNGNSHHGGNGGNGGGYGCGNSATKTVKVFAGGSSYAKAR